MFKHVLWQRWDPLSPSVEKVVIKKTLRSFRMWNFWTSPLYRLESWYSWFSELAFQSDLFRCSLVILRWSLQFFFHEIRWKFLKLQWTTWLKKVDFLLWIGNISGAIIPKNSPKIVSFLFLKKFFQHMHETPPYCFNLKHSNFVEDSHWRIFEFLIWIALLMVRKFQNQPLILICIDVQSLSIITKGFISSFHQSVDQEFPTWSDSFDMKYSIFS